MIPDGDALDELAPDLGVEPGEAAAALGGRWRRVSSDDVADTVPIGPAYVSGEPVQVLLSIEQSARTLTVAQPHVRWVGHAVALSIGRVHLQVPLGPALALEDVGQAVRAAATAQRRRFRWCRHCRVLQDPSALVDRNTCMSCASTYEGVVF